MSLEFRQGMDPNSRDVVLNQEDLGMLQSHEGEPQLVLRTNGKVLIYLPIVLLRRIVEESDKIQAEKQK